MRVLITGGAGFVGANVAVGFAERHPDWDLVALDNLRRRGSELNLPRLGAAGVAFVHGDVRSLQDLMTLGPVQAIVECSAEPSAMAGLDDSPDYVVKSNLLGAYNCLELARRDNAHFVFLSTSRVYPVEGLRSLAVRETGTRLELLDHQPVGGASAEGIAETFSLEGPRTIYGSTKLAAELLIEEYRHAYGVPAVINRCGVIAGPWQMGKVDQGVFTYWMLAHHFNQPLRYIGFGGHGKQVRDLLHVEDLVDLLNEQLMDPVSWDGAKLNVGGGRTCSLSLLETTDLCAAITGRRLEVERVPQTRPGDIPLYISDCRALYARTQWRPRRQPEAILADIHRWIAEHEDAVRQAL